MINVNLSVLGGSFLGGLFVAVTPCVYPLVPITVAIFGGRGTSKRRSFMLASSYVFGMAVLYAGLAVPVALAGGSGFGSWLGDPRVVVPIAVLLLTLAASMFGAFNLALPPSMQSKLSTVGGAGPSGAFFMGLVSGFLVAPCSGPATIAMLASVAAASVDGGSMLGAIAIAFSFALGIGVPFFFVALGATLFKPGRWNEYMKSVFGIALVDMAFWIARPAFPALGTYSFAQQRWTGMALGVGVALLGALIGAIHLSFKEGSWLSRMRKGLGVATCAVGVAATMNAYDIVQSHDTTAATASEHVPFAEWNTVTTLAELTTQLERASATNKPVLLDFAAAWCRPCKELERNTLHSDSVRAHLSDRYHLIKVDVTEGTDEQTRIQESFGVPALPGLAIYGVHHNLESFVEGVAKGGSFPTPSKTILVVLPPDEFVAAIKGFENQPDHPTLSCQHDNCNPQRG